MTDDRFAALRAALSNNDFSDPYGQSVFTCKEADIRALLDAAERGCTRVTTPDGKGVMASCAIEGCQHEVLLERAERAEAERDRLAAALRRLLVVVGEGPERVIALGLLPARIVKDAEAALAAVEKGK